MSLASTCRGQCLVAKAACVQHTGNLAGIAPAGVALQASSQQSPRRWWQAVALGTYACALSCVSAVLSMSSAAGRAVPVAGYATLQCAFLGAVSLLLWHLRSTQQSFGKVAAATGTTSQPNASDQAAIDAGLQQQHAVKALQGKLKGARGSAATLRTENGRLATDGRQLAALACMMQTLLCKAWAHIKSIQVRTELVFCHDCASSARATPADMHEVQLIGTGVACTQVMIEVTVHDSDVHAALQDKLTNVEGKAHAQEQTLQGISAALQNSAFVIDNVQPSSDHPLHVSVVRHIDALQVKARDAEQQEASAQQRAQQLAADAAQLRCKIATFNCLQS